MSTEETNTPLALPVPSTSNADTQKVQLDLEQISSLKFDSLGPMIVNSDGVSTSTPLSVPYLMLIFYGTLPSPNSPKIGDGLVTALWGRNRLWGLTIIGAPLHPSTRI